MSDTGPGISVENQKRIFEPFEQLDNSIRRQYGGSGLGLTISKQFIEMHGGHLWLESHVGQGTTFYFSFPYEASNIPGMLPEDPGFQGRSERIQRALVPDDETGFRLRTRPSRVVVTTPNPRLVVVEREQSLERLLARYLPNVDVVHNADLAVAIESLHHSPAQALIINNPPDDESALKALAWVPFGTPVISCWLPDEVTAAEQLGVAHYLVKPLTRERLLRLLTDLPVQLGLDHDIHTILIVDDEPDELHLFARMIESDPHGYSVFQANDGRRALTILQARKPDLILLDLIMPVLDGYGVLREMQKSSDLRDIPVVVISSRDPAGEAINMNTVRVSYKNGFSTRNLLEFIQAVMRIFLPGG